MIACRSVFWLGGSPLMTSSSSNPPRLMRRAVNAPHLVALVRAGAPFTGGGLAERPQDPQPEAA